MFGLIKQVFIGLLCSSRSLASIVNTPDHITRISLDNAWFDLPLLIYILMNTLKDCATIHSRLIQIDPWEVVIFLMICPKEYVFQTKQNIQIWVFFNMITGINEWKKSKKHILCKCKWMFVSIKCNSNQKRNNDK